MVPKGKERSLAVTRVLYICLAASTIISIIKILYGRSSGSLAFIADGIHSMFDSGSTVIGIISVMHAAKPPDKEHPYGHKKFETMAAMFLAMMLMLAGFEVAEAAYGRILTPERIPRFSVLGLIILGATMLINLSVAMMEARAARKYRSSFLSADSLHNQSDFMITCGVFVSFLSAKYQIPHVDAVTSFAIALYLAFLALKVVQGNVKPLVDHSVLDPKAVEAVVEKVDGVITCHNVRSRGEKDHHFLDLHIHLPSKISLEKAHEITHQVEERLQEAFPGLVDVVIHTEPDDHPPCRLQEW